MTATVCVIASPLGCLGPQPDERPPVVGTGVPLRPVDFESPEVKRQFEAEVQQAYRRGEGWVVTPNVYEPQNKAYDVKLLKSKSLFYNDQVEICDADRNKLITSAELHAYLKRPKQRVDRTDGGP